MHNKFRIPARPRTIIKRVVPHQNFRRCIYKDDTLCVVANSLNITLTASGLLDFIETECVTKKIDPARADLSR